MNAHISFQVVFAFAVTGFLYSLLKGGGSLKLGASVAVVASAELLANASSLSGVRWVADVFVAAALMLTASRKARSAMLNPVSKSEVVFGAVVLYCVAVCVFGVVLYPWDSVIRIACLVLVYFVGARIIGESVSMECAFESAGRAVLFCGWILPAAVLVAATAVSGLLGVGDEARFDSRTPIQLGVFSTPRLMNSALGPTFVGHASLLTLMVVTFGYFRSRSLIVKAIAVAAWLSYGSVLVWSGTRTALFAGWLACCATLLVFSLNAHRSHVRRRAWWALAVALVVPLGGIDAISRFLNRSSDSGVLDIASLYQAGRRQYSENVFRWIGYNHDPVWGAGLGANNVVTGNIINTSAIQRDSGYGIIEPFFELIAFEWGVVGGTAYAAYWLLLSWIVVRGDLRDIRRGTPWAGLATCWVLYVWASSVTSFGFGMVNNTLLVMFGMSRVVNGASTMGRPRSVERCPNSDLSSQLCSHVRAYRTWV